MSLGGMLGAALSGGANAAGEIARGNIQRQGQLDLAREMALIDEERAKRVREANFNFENDPANVATRAGTAATLARGAATTQRGIDLDRLRDPELTAAEREKADRDAAAALERKTTEMKALAPVEAERAGLIAKAQAKYRERPTAAASADAMDKLPPAVKAQVQTLSKQAEQINNAIVKAQADGVWDPDSNKAQAELLIRQRVLEDRAAAVLEPYLPKSEKASGGDDRIRALLTGQGGADAKPAEPAAGGKVPPRRAEPASPMANMDDNTLRRIANIDGHARQQEAKAELARRAKANASDGPAPGYDYGTMTP